MENKQIINLVLEEMILEELQKKKYEKPEIKKEETMTFPFRNFLIGKIACRQCSSCHGCR